MKDAVADELAILEDGDIEIFDEAIEELDSLAFDLAGALETELAYSL